MPSRGINLFIRIIARNPKVYVLKIISLALAFASSTVVILFAMNEFGYDRFHRSAENIYRVYKRNNSEEYNGNRFSVKIPSRQFQRLKERGTTASRVNILNGLQLSANGNTLQSQTVHAADQTIFSIFSVDVVSGTTENFQTGTVILSSSLVKKMFGTTDVKDKSVILTSPNGSARSLKIAAVFADFPANSHETFNSFIPYDSTVLDNLGFNSHESGVYVRTEETSIEQMEKSLAYSSKTIAYGLQPITEIYFGRRMLGEQAQHGDSYSVLILTFITTLILLLAITNYAILTTLTLPYRAKEVAVKKLAGTTQRGLAKMFLAESFSIVLLSLLVAVVILIFSSPLIEPVLAINIANLLVAGDRTFIAVIALTTLVVAVAPLMLTLKFIHASPSNLLGASTVTFPKIKRTLTVIQLGVSMLVLVLALVMKRQIEYSLVKEPGRNNDQIVYLDYPSDLTQEGLTRLREGWRSYHPNILDVLATSHLPHYIVSKEMNSQFYVMSVDPMFPRFFGLNMIEGNWYKPNANDSTLVVNRAAMNLLTARQRKNVIGVLEDVTDQFNATQKPIKFKLVKAEKYNYLFIRILEVDIRRTVNFLSSTFQNSKIKFLDTRFEQWLNYQDKLNVLSNILAIIAAILSCFAIYGLALSFVKEKMKQLAVHKIYGAGFVEITVMLVKHFGREMLVALLCFTPLTYFLTNEVLRNFAYATSLQWNDTVIPVVFSMSMIIILSALQVLRLNIVSLVTALKS